MKKLNNNYEAPQVEWVELSSESVIMFSGSMQSSGGTWVNP